jgi:hypothetical protein
MIAGTSLGTSGKRTAIHRLDQEYRIGKRRWGMRSDAGARKRSTLTSAVGDKEERQ